MFKKLIQKLKSLNPKPSPFDPATLNDPVAMQTDWTPNQKGGSNICTHRLIQACPDRVLFKSTTTAKLIATLLLLVGLGVLMGTIYSILQQPEGGKIIPILIGLVFTSVGGWALYKFSIPIVFDRQQELYWKSFKNPKEVFQLEKNDSFIPLENIYALQIIEELCHSKNGSYYCYELNLILTDARRITVVDHGNIEHIHQDARSLADFLNKPLWIAK